MQAGRALLAKKNLFDIVTKLPGDGIGAKLQRKTWPPESFWTLTAVRPTVDGHRGKAWGIFTWKGTDKTSEPTPVRGTQKKVWRIYEQTDNPLEWKRLPVEEGGSAGQGVQQAA